ncbi:MAG: DUF3796 domain-containing protein [Lachnospiraceae bacterium]|jgi:hypothetical protein|nr:DUF3796 domain-containing protein [Lachnospiraceae bacterium]
MKRNNKKLPIFLGAACAVLVAAASWYTVTFHDSRLLAPMNMSEYTFQVKDLPMLVSGTCLVLYLLYLFILLLRAILANQRREGKSQITRTLNPKLGLLGFVGLAGFLGFWTYSVDKTIFPFVFFIFFGFFGFFYEGKMSATFMDERFQENRMKASAAANRIAITVIFAAILILGQGRLMGNLEYTLIALIIVVALSIALQIFLSEYLLYRYDHQDAFEESEE